MDTKSRARSTHHGSKLPARAEFNVRPWSSRTTTLLTLRRREWARRAVPDRTYFMDACDKKLSGASWQSICCPFVRCRGFPVYRREEF